MKTKYKFINFRELTSKGKTSVYFCLNNSSSATIGVIKWYGPWRQYCYFSDENAVYSQGCLDDISHFMKQLKEVKT